MNYDCCWAQKQEGCAALLSHSATELDSLHGWNCVFYLSFCHGVADGSDLSSVSTACFFVETYKKWYII